jgi:hypothetical protein
VLLSIVGVDRIEGNAHYAGKRHEFAGTVVGWMRQGDVATVPPLLVQPVAAA